MSLEASQCRDLQAVQKQILALAQLQAPRSLPELQSLYQHSLGERLSSLAGVLGRPSVREVVERPDGRWFRTPSHGEVLNSVTAHALRPPSCSLVGTDPWCGWSFARITSAGLRRCRLASQPLRSMLREAPRRTFVIVLLFIVLTQLRNIGHPRSGRPGAQPPPTVSPPFARVR